MSQTNTRQGDIPVIAGEDLTGKEDRLAVIVNDAGIAKAKLPDDVADRTLYLIIEGAAAGAKASLRPLTPDRNVRVKLDGACNPGDRMTLAAIDGTKDGACRALPAAADIYHIFGRAEEVGVDTQTVLVRPSNEGPVTVSA